MLRIDAQSMTYASKKLTLDKPSLDEEGVI